MNETVPDPRADRIIQVAMELAEADGYDAVRLRDLAAKADVALGTVYRRFGSKEDILAAALERLACQFHDAIVAAPIPGESPTIRIGLFFELATRTLSERPKLASALLRTVASGVPELAARVLNYRDRITDILVIVYRGEVRAEAASERERQMAHLLQNLWFAELVGWTGGIETAEDVIRRTQEGTALVFKALDLPS